MLKDTLQYSRTGTEENNENPQTAKPASENRFEPRFMGSSLN
jgi:hypothetical protein